VSSVAPVRRFTADLMLLATVTLWALNFTVSKYVLTHGLEPLSYSTTRYFVAALLFAGITRVSEGTLAVSARDLPLLLGCSAVLLLNQVSFVYALHFSTASTVALLFGTLPIFTGLIAAAVGVEPLSTRFAAASLLSFAGVALIAVGSGGEVSGSIKGDALALLGAATWAAYTVAIPPLMGKYSPYRISVVVLLATTLMLALVGKGQLEAQTWPSDGLLWAGFAFAVIGPLVVTNVLWFRATTRVGPSHASMFANLQPFLAAIVAVLVLSESLSVAQIVGGVAIAAGIVIARPRSATPALE
jgi:drug/metabolite transporter (DMT)-like permease